MSEQPPAEQDEALNDSLTRLKRVLVSRGLLPELVDQLERDPDLRRAVSTARTDFLTWSAVQARPSQRDRILEQFSSEKSAGALAQFLSALSSTQRLDSALPLPSLERHARVREIAASAELDVEGMLYLDRWWQLRLQQYGKALEAS